MQLAQIFGRGAAVLAGIVAGALALSQPAEARMADFTGHWRNTDPHTDNLTRADIEFMGFNHVRVHAFGQCHPTDCDWGTQTGVFEHGMGGTVRVEFDSGFSDTRLVLHNAPGDQLSYDMHVDFTDRSGRAPYDRHGLLERADTMGGGGGHGPGPDGRHGGMLGSEDCLPEPWASLAVAHVGGDWKIVNGSEWVLDFGSNKTAADRSLDIIRHYRFDQICYVQRPNAAMTYWKRNGQVPSGNMPDEDCVNFNPHTASAAHVGGAWKVVDGSVWLLDYGSNEAAADQALAVIQNYNLNRQCFVARPNPPMQYYLSQ
jgi:hypothetical protein